MRATWPAPACLAQRAAAVRALRGYMGGTVGLALQISMALGTSIPQQEDAYQAGGCRPGQEKTGR